MKRMVGLITGITNLCYWCTFLYLQHKGCNKYFILLCTNLQESRSLWSSDPCLSSWEFTGIEAGQEYQFSMQIHLGANAMTHGQIGLDYQSERLSSKINNKEKNVVSEVLFTATRWLCHLKNITSE